MTTVGMLIDLTRCKGCNACVYACKEQNNLPADNPNQLGARTWVAVQQKENTYVRKQCMHCIDPACVSVCPVAALQKQKNGPVTYDEDRCMGCRYCMMACPFQIPKYEWAQTQPRVQKCILCAEKRLKQNKQPACTEICPTQAAIFGDREKLILEAQTRIRNHPKRYVNHIYGLQEVGGTSVLYLSAVPFAQLGFPTGVETEPYPRLTWKVLSQIPNVLAVGGTLMLGLWWISNRREKVAREESTQNQEV
jgi:formate dehydrogenase iron-sulfur subunit